MAFDLLPGGAGVFDKVGNAWYAAQVFLRADRLDQSSLIKAAAASAACVPSRRACCVPAARGQDRSLANVLRSLHVSALAFFLSRTVREGDPRAAVSVAAAEPRRRTRRGVFSVIGVHALPCYTTKVWRLPTRRWL